MVRRKRKRKRSKDWHHRVPDFKLVYCGPPKKRTPKENSGHATRERRIAVSMATDREVNIAELDKPKRKKKIKQIH
jgi:hypothetical protein